MISGVVRPLATNVKVFVPLFSMASNTMLMGCNLLNVNIIIQNNNENKKGNDRRIRCYV